MIKLKTLVVLIMLFSTNSLMAQSGFQWAYNLKIRTVMGSSDYLGCMIRVENLQTDLNCKDNWVSLDCEDRYHVNGKIRFSIAQSAALAGKGINLQIDKSRKTGGFCLAKRIETNY